MPMSPRRMEAPGGVQLYLTMAKHRTYVQMASPPVNTKRLLVEVSSKMSSEHRSVCIQLFKFAAKHGADKEKLGSKRAALINASSA